MKIGILQTGRSPEQLVADHGEYGDMFQTMLAGRGFSFHVYDTLAMEFPKSATDCDGWLITGSKFGAYEDHPWIPPLEQLIRDIQAAQIPLIGVCFGHQIIAQALGGTVEKYAGGWSAGRVEYDMADGRKVALHAWHQDQVTVPPKGAVTTASTDFCEHAALTIGDTIYTIQPHPEFDADFVRGLAIHRAPGVVPEPQRLAAIDSLGPAVAKSELADQFEAFFKKNHHQKATAHG